MSRVKRSTNPLHFLKTSDDKNSFSVFKNKQDRQCTYNVTFKADSPNNYCRGKSISITYSECVFVALGILHAMRMRRIILSPVVCPAVQYFYTLFHKRQDLREKRF